MHNAYDWVTLWLGYILLLTRISSTTLFCGEALNGCYGQLLGTELTTKGSWLSSLMIAYNMHETVSAFNVTDQ